jgi:hypothetical protein
MRRNRVRILAIITGEYGQRHVDNLRAHGPDHWQIEVWKAPSIYPLVIDYPEDFLPDDLPPADLVLAFGEHKGVAELVPEVVKATGARAVIAPVDREEWLPRGLARQLRGWLADMGVVCVTPKPLCSLTETSYNVRRHRIEYDDPLIAEFARYFGKPEFRITVDPETRAITEVEVTGMPSAVAADMWPRGWWESLPTTQSSKRGCFITTIPVWRGWGRTSTSTTPSCISPVTS